MAKKKTYGRRESGGAAMKRLGRHPILLGASKEELAILDDARELVPRAKWIMHHALEVARATIAERNARQSKNSA